MGDTLGTLVEEVQYELVQVASPAVGQNFREHIKARIRREYRRLYNDFDWPHLLVWRDLETAAGQRYYDFPTGTSLETVIRIYRWWGNEYVEIERGFEPTVYNAFNSDDDIRSDPVMRWRPYESQMEVWPIPASNDIPLRFVCKKAFTPLVEEDDVCDLDTDLVVLHAAAQLARKYDNDDAAIILARAKQHYDTLKSRTNRGVSRVNWAADAPTYRKGFADKTIIGVAPR